MCGAERDGETRGLVIVNTGDGKGKTTAALGLMMRAWGREMRVGMVQFIKNEKRQTGELKAAERIGIEWHGSGDGWTWKKPDLQSAEDRALQGWEMARSASPAADTTCSSWTSSPIPCTSAGSM